MFLVNCKYCLELNVLVAFSTQLRLQTKMNVTTLKFAVRKKKKMLHSVHHFREKAQTWLNQKENTFTDNPPKIKTDDKTAWKFFVVQGSITQSYNRSTL